MATNLVLLGISFLIIILGAELFTNGIEWLGVRLKLSEGTVGSVLAAVGTALPETLIPFVALVFFREASSHDIGVGAILGAPFMLATLGFFVTAAAAIAYRRRRETGWRLDIDRKILGRDLVNILVAENIDNFLQQLVVTGADLPVVGELRSGRTRQAKHQADGDQNFYCTPSNHSMLTFRIHMRNIRRCEIFVF